MQETIYLTHILFLLAAAVLTVPIFQRLGLGSMLGYLTAGVIVGPWGAGLISQVEEIRHIAEFGVVFLLFIIGIELNFSRLMAMRRMVLGLGLSQLLITGGLLTSVAVLFNIPVNTAIIVGFGLALSSTAFGLQTLTEQNEMASQTGRTSFSILLLQDLAVVPLLTLVSFLAQDDTTTWFSFLQGSLVIIAVILTGRFVLPPVLRLIAASQNSEVFIAAAILVVLGTAWLLEATGLSMALGAFLAGLILADSHYRHQIVADIQPFRGLLLGLFFMSVGMSVDFGILMQKPLLIVGLVGALLTIKILVILSVCKIARIESGISIRVSMLLSQSGEFGFVLFGLAVVLGLMDMELFQILTLIIAMSMIMAPFTSILGLRIAKRLRKNSRKTFSDKTIKQLDEEYLIILVGFGRVGRRVAKILDAGGVTYLALDSSPDLVTKGAKDGFNVIYGDARRHDVLNTMGATRASAIVITIDKANITERLVHLTRSRYPEIPIYVRGHDKEHCEKLHKAGASISVSETLEASLKLGGAALTVSGINSETASDLLDDFREVYYEGLNDE
ncbi:MAG: cation:proton antiporter [Rhizobiales bacterium]|nr:monovalent cation:proton antiporter-2 (CPA2) family protein [Hyphomicrobiales bacterium]NRB14416.1 cation:proton antiporter [Hyphomicrobiales bacterium]